MPNHRRSRLTAVTTVALLLSVLPVLAFAAPAAQGAAPAAAPAGSLWTKSAQKPQASLNGHQRSVNPSSYKAYTLSRSGMASLLAQAPNEDSAAARRGGAVTVSIPAPTGELVEFAVVESPVMEPELAAAHPEITTYAGNSVTEGYEGTIRLDQTLLGFHASVIGSDKKSWYIDPAYVGDTSLYLSYFGDALPAPEKPLVEPEITRETKRALKRGATQDIGEGANGAVNRREYRLALVTDPSYADYFGATGSDATSDPIVLSAKTTMMNRVNQLYNDDLAVKLLLVNGTDKLNFQTNAEFTGANGPCGTAPCYDAVNDAAGCYGDPDDATGTSPYVIDGNNTKVIGLLIGAENYDIGHIAYGAAGDGGGVAYLASVGMGEEKAGGCTGLDPPTGDFFAIDYVAHEIGHQFNGDHTFNSPTLCGSGNRSDGGAAAVEPGGGSSIMAYAGICGRDDLQPHSDPYFSQKTQAEVTSHITASTTSYNEIQVYGLGSFGGTDSFKLDFGGTQTATITNGTNYTTGGLKTAIEAAIGGTVTASAVTAAGFTLTYSGAKANTNIVNPTIVPTVVGSFTWVGGDYIKGGASTNNGTVIATTNHNPTVTAPAAKTIPVRTPFTLTGSATDSDGNPMVYLWEQNNTATTGTALVTQPKLTGPLFRVFGKYANVTYANSILYNSAGENLATTSPSRTFPDIEQIVANETNAASGSCPSGAGSGALPNNNVLRCFSEFLPTAAYTPSSMTFRLTARDQVATGGGTHYADVVLTLDKTKGPFLVSSPNTAVTYAGGSSQTVTWTSGMDTLSANVKISLSTDGGLTYPTVIAASTPNDGSQSVTIPNVATTTARIKVEAVENYFFDISDANFTITSSAPTGLQVTQPGNPSQSVQYSDPIASVGFSATTDQPSGVLAASIDGATPLPAGLSLSPRTGSDTSASWTVTGTTTAAPNTYNVTAKVTDGTTTTNVPLTFTVTQENATPTYTGDTTKAAPAGQDHVDVNLAATVAQAADGNLGDLANATATFVDTTTSTTLCSSPVSTGGTASCTYNAAAPGTYQVKVNVGGRYTGTTGADTTLTVTATTTPPPVVVPETTLTSGPGAWLLDTAATYGYSSSLPGSTFTCGFDGAPAPCAPPTTWTGLATGSHVFTVAATKDGQTDATPARSVTTVPVDDVALKAKGDWKRKKSGQSFLGTYTSVKEKGAKLKLKIKDARALALVASTSPKAGKVKVFLGKKLIATVNLKGAKQSKVVFDLATLVLPTNGKLTIVTTSKRQVRIDGLGVATTL